MPKLRCGLIAFVDPAISPPSSGGFNAQEQVFYFSSRWITESLARLHRDTMPWNSTLVFISNWTLLGKNEFLRQWWLLAWNSDDNFLMGDLITLARAPKLQESTQWIWLIFELTILYWGKCKNNGAAMPGACLGDSIIYVRHVVGDGGVTME